MWFLSAGMRRLNNTVIKHRTTRLCSVPKITFVEKVRRAVPKRWWGQDESLCNLMSLTGGLSESRQLHIRIRRCRAMFPGSHEWWPVQSRHVQRKHGLPMFSSWDSWKTIRDQLQTTIRNLWHRQPSQPKWSLLFNSWDSYLEPDKGWNSEWTRPSKTEMSDPVVRHGDNGHEEHARGLENDWSSWKLPNFNFNSNSIQHSWRLYLQSYFKTINVFNQ